MLSCHIPYSIIEARKYRIHLKRDRIKHQVFCKYINGEAPIENGIWAYRYIDSYRPRYRGRRFVVIVNQVDIIAPYENGQLQGLVKEDYGGSVIEKYYTNGQVDSIRFFRREFRRGNPEDTLILGSVQKRGEEEENFEHYYFWKLCNTDTKKD